MAKASQVVIMEGEYYIIKSPNGKVLEVKDFNTENGAGIQLWSYAGHPWQQWQFVDAGEGRWRIQNRFTGKMIDLALGGVVEGTWLHQWSRTSGLSQCWALEPTRSGRTRIRNVLSDKYIDLVGMNTANGAQAQIWNYVAGIRSGDTSQRAAAQRFMQQPFLYGKRYAYAAAQRRHTVNILDLWRKNIGQKRRTPHELRRIYGPGISHLQHHPLLSGAGGGLPDAAPHQKAG